VNLAKDVIDSLHSSAKESMNEEGDKTILGFISSALNRRTKMLNNIKVSFDKSKDKSEEK
jgi:hypothetical protein